MMAPNIDIPSIPTRNADSILLYVVCPVRTVNMTGPNHPKKETGAFMLCSVSIVDLEHEPHETDTMPETTKIQVLKTDSQIMQIPASTSLLPRRHRHIHRHRPQTHSHSLAQKYPAPSHPSSPTHAQC